MSGDHELPWTALRPAAHATLLEAGADVDALADLESPTDLPEETSYSE